ncbi:Cgl0159 family (beta/alpha)8-fold protein [Pseudactinotalea sp. Z1748]|uniref:Cgl0159 family (beta/alpha)8-fold protein n=1 Tax=Pseudactinotalea sp. Z1748 TaxID=3413027 RepID=UPI003C7A5F86
MTMSDGDPRRYEHLTETRLHDPGAVLRAAQTRPRHPGPQRGRQLFILASDHPARGALGVKDDPLAMADRRDLLDRLQTALAHPRVDGVLASPDILDDLLLLGAVDGKLLFGSMNRAGLPGLVNEVDDRFTGHTAAGLAAIGAAGGKMLTRIAFDDTHTTSMLEATARAVDALHRHQMVAMIEPFISMHRQGQLVNDLSTDAVVRSVAIAQGLGGSSARTWLKLPVVAEMERVMAATTLPTVLLGGSAAAGTEDILATWAPALRLPGVQGLTAGRVLLYPDDGDVARAVEVAAGLLRGGGARPDSRDPAKPRTSEEEERLR